MKPKTNPPAFLKLSSNGLYTLPAELRKLCTDPNIEPDVLTNASQQRKWELTSNPCPECGGAVEEHYDPDNIFSPDEPLPRAFVKCVDCEYTFEPNSGMTVNTSKPWKVEEALPIIKPSED